MHNLVYQYLIVFVTGLFGIWKAVPVGLAFGLDAVAVYLLTTAGAIVAAILIYFFGYQFRKILYRKKKSIPSKRETRAKKLLEKYGPIGLGFFGSILMGPNLTLIIGLILVKSAKTLVFWTILGILFWTAVLILLAMSGIRLFEMIGV